MVVCDFLDDGTSLCTPPQGTAQYKAPLNLRQVQFSGANSGVCCETVCQGRCTFGALGEGSVCDSGSRSRSVTCVMRLLAVSLPMPTSS